MTSKYRLTTESHKNNYIAKKINIQTTKSNNTKNHLVVFYAT